MTEEQSRMSNGMRTPALACSEGSATQCDHYANDLFENSGFTPVQPHPTFEARAAIWRLFSEGAISFAEAQRRSAAIGAPQTSAKVSQAPKRSSSRPRHARPAPEPSRQYLNPMATTAARDDRLTPQAKALLQILRARAGEGRTTATTKTTLAAVLSRSCRSIVRYLRDLERFGYILTEIRRTARGLHTGLVITLTEVVMPFWAEAKGLARWLGETATIPFTPFRAASLGLEGVTLLTPKNQSDKDSFYQDLNSLRKYQETAPPLGD